MAELIKDYREALDLKSKEAELPPLRAIAPEGEGEEGL